MNNKIYIMPPKKSVILDKSLDATKLIDDENESDLEETVIDMSNKYNSSNSSQLRDMIDFLNDPNIITQARDPSTNIINVLTGKSYNIPESKIPKFFAHLERCRREHIYTMMEERQNEYSGIMLDFDIIQDDQEDQITEDIYQTLCMKIIDFLAQVLYIDAKKQTTYIGISRKKKIKYVEDKNYYKTGFHMLIPGIQIRREVKQYIIKKLIENEILYPILMDIKPKKDHFNIDGTPYTQNNYLDINCAHVPVFFIGSSSRKGAPAHNLIKIYEVVCNFDSKITIVNQRDSLLNDISKNLCHEFSLNFAVKDGLIKKIQYECNLDIQQHIKKSKSSQNAITSIEDSTASNYSKLSLYGLKDPQVQEVEKLLSVLNYSRVDNYGDWFNVLCILANQSPMYKILAEEFSKKSPKYNAESFELAWSSALKGPSRNQKVLTLATLHFWAKNDNPEKYNIIRNKSIAGIINNMAYTDYKTGELSHSDIAKILHYLLKYKYVCDIADGASKPTWYEFIIDQDIISHNPGEIYKWKKINQIHPNSMSVYISEILPALFQETLSKIKKNKDSAAGVDDGVAKHIKRIQSNFEKSIRNLEDHRYKNSVMQEAMTKFFKYGFIEQLDSYPLVRGVANGILKLSTTPGQKPVLIKGYHNYAINKFTKVPYVEFNPFDPLTKKLIYMLRNMFPEDEPDTHEWVLSYLASTLDSNPKESIFLNIVGDGSMGKSTIIELHKDTIGDHYCRKLDIGFLTSTKNDPDRATTTLNMLQYASIALCSETNPGDVVNMRRIKELTGHESMYMRKLNEEGMNFKPKCHILVITNHKLTIPSNDYGSWRRIYYLPLKISFRPPDIYEIESKTNPNCKLVDDSVSKLVNEVEFQSRYMGYLVWMYYWLQNKYKGKLFNIPHPHIKFDTKKYRIEQDIVSEFISSRLVALANKEDKYPLSGEIDKYVTWVNNNSEIKITKKTAQEAFTNSEIGKYIKVMSRSKYLVGYRFLSKEDEALEIGETYYRETVNEEVLDGTNFGITPESADQYYDRTCREYLANKEIFISKESDYVTSDLVVGNELINAEMPKEKSAAQVLKEAEEYIEYHDNGVVKGTIYKPLPEDGRYHQPDDEIELVEMYGEYNIDELRELGELSE